jgi:ABC-2 type transport system permease protein
MERLITIIRKEFYHILRDRLTLGLILLLPALLLILLGFGVSTESKDITMVAADLSKTDASRRYLEYYTASDDFEILYDALNEDEIIDMIDRNKVKVGLLIPEDFGRMVETGDSVSVQLYINGSADPVQVQTIQLKLSAIAQTSAQDILVEKIQSAGAASAFQIPINALSRILYNPDGDGGIFMIPGLIPIILLMQTLLLSALAIVREREQGTMEQLIVTPVKSWELMVGKMIPYLIVSIFTTISMFFLGQWIFGVSIAGSFWQLLGLSVIFIIGSLGMGVLISNISKTQMQAVYLAVFVVLIPAIILSGLMMPRDDMPLFTYAYSALLPVTYYLEITRGIMLRGVGADMLLSSIIPLIILSVIYSVASVLVFRKRI